MARAVKRIVQTPKALRRERATWLSMERRVDVELRRLDPDYGIANLIRRPDGRMEFEAACEFKPRHRDAVARIFSRLQWADQETEFVQAKDDPPRAVQKRIKQQAALLDERVREEVG